MPVQLFAYTENYILTHRRVAFTKRRLGNRLFLVINMKPR